jgi:hypothetical protein
MKIDNNYNNYNNNRIGFNSSFSCKVNKIPGAVVNTCKANAKLHGLTADSFTLIKQGEGKTGSFYGILKLEPSDKAKPILTSDNIYLGFQKPDAPFEFSEQMVDSVTNRMYILLEQAENIKVN